MRISALLPIWVAAMATVSTARAQPSAPPADDPAAAAAPDEAGSETQPTPLAVVVEAGDIDRQAIVEAVLAELSARLEPSSPRRLVVTIDEREVAVRYEAPDRDPVRRRVARPAGREATIEAVALLAGNLARDQAGALLAALATPAISEATDESGADEGQPKVAIAAPRVPSSSRREPLPSAPAPSPDAVDAPVSPVQAAFVWPLAVYPDGDERIFGFDLSVLFGNSGGLRGLGLHAIGGSTHGDQQGLAISGIWTYRGGSLAGLGLAGVVSASGGETLTGMEMAGVANLAVLGERPALVKGLQMAGVANAAGDLRGAQLAGVSNLGRNGAGAQIAGISNHAGELSGVQISGGVNTARTITGAQIGLVNVARRVEGLQLGLVNVAEQNEGTAVGLVNLAGDGDVQVVTWAALSALSNVGVKMRVGPLFVQPALGYDPFGGHSIDGQMSLGLHFPLDPLFVEAVLGYGYDKPIAREEGTPESELEGHHRTRLIGQVGAQVTESFGFFGGAGLIWDVTDSVENQRASVRPELTAGVLLF